MKAQKSRNVHNNKQKETISKQGNLQKWIIKSTQESKVYAIIGSRGSGKSCFAFEFMDWHNKLTNRKLYVYNFPKDDLLPDYIQNVNDLNNLEKGSVVLIDESGIEFNQFTFNSKKSIELANMIKIARHNDLSIIFIAQNGANLTKDVRRLIDCYILKNPSFSQRFDEIPLIKKMYQNCFMLFTTETQKRKGYYIAEIGEMGFSDVPSFWNENISKAYSNPKEPTNISKWINAIKQKV